MTSSAGTSGLILFASPPRSAIASRIAARSTTAGHAGEVLHHHARRREGDLLRRLGGVVPGRDRLDVLAAYADPVLVAEDVLEQDLQRERKPGDVVGGLEGIKTVDLIVAPADLEVAAGAKRILGGHASRLPRQGQRTLAVVDALRACRPCRARRPSAALPRPATAGRSGPCAAARCRAPSAGRGRPTTGVLPNVFRNTGADGTVVPSPREQPHLADVDADRVRAVVAQRAGEHAVVLDRRVREHAPPCRSSRAGRCGPSEPRPANAITATAASVAMPIIATARRPRASARVCGGAVVMKVLMLRLLRSGEPVAARRVRIRERIPGRARGLTGGLGRDPGHQDARARAVGKAGDDVRGRRGAVRADVAAEAVAAALFVPPHVVAVRVARAVGPHAHVVVGDLVVERGVDALVRLAAEGGRHVEQLHARRASCRRSSCRGRCRRCRRRCRSRCRPAPGTSGTRSRGLRSGIGVFLQ